MMNEMRQELAANPPLAGAYTPKKGAKCIAQFTDGLWLVRILSVIFLSYRNVVTVPLVN